MNVLVSGGGTVALIDDVRRITNNSTGRLSAMITEACLTLGAEVWHLHAAGAQVPYQRSAFLDFNTNVADELERLRQLHQKYRLNRPRLHLEALEVGTVQEYASHLERLLRTQAIDVVFLAMAVSDFEPVRHPGKLSSKAGTLVLECLPTPKVIKHVKDWNDEVFLVGFKLTSGKDRQEQEELGRQACRENRADLTVVNDQQAINAGRHELLLVRAGADPETLGPREEMAFELVERVFTLARGRMMEREPLPLAEDFEDELEFPASSRDGESDE